MVFHHNLFDIAHDQYYLIANIAPAPDTFMVRVVGLDEGLIGHAQELEVPLITRRKTSETLQLSECETLVATGISCNNRLVECVIFWETFVVVLDGGYPFTLSTPKVQ